ncbi:MAG: 50S ribosomal protein L23 [Patescibacteria group bacterium]
MGIFDKFKSKKGKADKKPAAIQAQTKNSKADQSGKSDAHETAVKPVVRPDGTIAAVAEKAEPKAKKKKITKEDTGHAYRVLLKPLVTEKGSLIGMYNKYIFQVAPGTNRVEVRKAIRKVYGVDPVKVNIINVLGKEIRYGRTEGQMKGWKKAIITLAAGQKIEIQEGL